MSTETNVVLIIGKGQETNHVIAAASQEGWSTQHIHDLSQLPPREHVDPEIIVLLSDLNWLTLTPEQKHALGKRVLWMVATPIWPTLPQGPLDLAGLISATASVEEIHFRMVSTIQQLNQQLLARLGLPTHVKGETLWDMLPTTDWVTGLENRTSFLQEVRKQISRSKRYHRPFCCLLVRIDNYKRFQSQLAPEVMEEMLSDVAGWLEMCIRDSDMLARIQQDTFGMLLPETDQNNVQHVVQRVNNYLNNFEFAHNLPEPLAFSVGVSTFAEDMVSLDSLLSLAQEDLHASPPKTADPS